MNLRTFARTILKQHFTHAEPSNPYDRVLYKERTAWDAYLKWRNEQVCQDCGKRFADKQADEPWATETQCWPCFKKQCEFWKKQKADALDVVMGRTGDILREYNEAHQALDDLGAPKTKVVLNTDRSGSQEIKLTLVERIRYLKGIMPR